MKAELCNIKTKMLSMIEAQMDCLEDVNVCELGEAIDIIKDIAEAEYYCEVVNSMHEGKAKSTNMINQTRDINRFLQTLNEDIVNMMDTMSPEERMMMRERLHDFEQMI